MWLYHLVPPPEVLLDIELGHGVQTAEAALSIQQRRQREPEASRDETGENDHA